MIVANLNNKIIIIIIKKIAEHFHEPFLLIKLSRDLSFIALPGNSL